jgi:hypothetical protein
MRRTFDFSVRYSITKTTGRGAPVGVPSLWWMPLQLVSQGRLFVRADVRWLVARDRCRVHPRAIMQSSRKAMFLTLGI